VNSDQAVHRLKTTGGERVGNAQTGLRYTTLNTAEIDGYVLTSVLTQADIDLLIPFKPFSLLD
jgi:hypothetical protein